MKTMLQRPDDSPFPGLARDPLPGQRHEGFLHAPELRLFALCGNPHPQTETWGRS